jgi:hypothetical protein
MRKCHVSISFCLSVLCLAILPSKAHCHPFRAQQRFDIKGDYVYVLPHSNIIFKIHKISGHIEWQTQVMTGLDNAYPLLSGSYSSPAFTEDRMLAVELFDKRLLGIDRESGKIDLDRSVLSGCLLGREIIFDFPSGRMMTCDEQALVFHDTGVTARGLPELEVRWKFTCQQRDLLFLNNHFKLNESLYLEITLPRDGISLEEAYLNQELSGYEFELVELNCATGEVINRYGKDFFFGDKKVEMWGIEGLGEWRGSALFLVEAGPFNYSLYKVDPVTKSISMLIERLNDLGSAKGAWLDRELKPVLLGDTIFYNLDNGAEILLSGRSLMDGKILLNVAAEKGEKLYAGVEDQLFSLIHDDDRRFTVICRDAATGEICWKRKIKIRGEDKDTIPSQIEMKTSDGHLYLLTGGYMRAFDATNGKMLWEVLLYPEEEGVDEEGLWDRILSFFD